MSTSVHTAEGKIRTGKSSSKLEKATRPRKSKMVKEKTVETEINNPTVQQVITALLDKNYRANWEAFKTEHQGKGIIKGIKFKHVCECVVILRAMNNGTPLALSWVEKINRWLTQHEFGALVAMSSVTLCKLDLPSQHDGIDDVSLGWKFTERSFPILQYVFYNPTHDRTMVPKFMVSPVIDDKRITHMELC
jgi:hypothetical protein